MIVAGAGTGKTTVITQRLAWLILQKKIGTDNILALTFTDKAAGEMEERVDVLLPYGYVDLWVSTFHAFCERILKDNALAIGLPPDFKLLNQTEQALLIHRNFEQFDLDYYRPLGNPTKFIQALVKHFSRAKDEDVLPNDYLEYAKDLKLDRDQEEFLKKKEGEEISEKQRITEVANAYHTYQQLLLDNSALDFGDLIIYTIKLFKQRPKILEKYREQFQYLLVDEFQDTNYAQYELIKLLAAPQNNLTVVGDDDQCLPGEIMVDTLKGRKMIKNIKVGEQVLTAVGKGHVGFSTVTKVLKNHKQARFITFTTEFGHKITATDNHKMFCYVPPKPKKLDYFYVYLMYRQNLGWRIGITNDLCTRLRLERSADKIIGLRAFVTEQEARYWETFYSLKYSIPSVCFKEREGVVIVNEWLEKLYQDIDTEQGARKLAKELGIDLEAHHYSLQGIVRGSASRVKIYLDLCYRKYRSKEHVQKGKLLIGNPLIAHAVSLETSDKETISKLKKAGYKLNKAKKGWKFKMQTNDIKEAGQIALRLQKLTGGILEHRFSVGRINYQHRPALIMPAGNVLAGHYLPVRSGNNIEYEMVKKVEVKEKGMTVYDLEINRTHNFIADNFVVHNSIYKFRGAAISNILEFKKDFPDSKEIILTKNYRSKQNILDLAYKFIQLNNPNRLEHQLSAKVLDDKGKPLKSKVIKQLKATSKGNGILEHLHYKSHLEEASGVVKKIIELKKKDKKLGWSDFAILVRANSYANGFITSLARHDVPYQYIASSGLYSQPEVLDVIAYLKMLDNYHESASLWRVLNFSHWHLPAAELMALSKYASRKNTSLYETLRMARLFPDMNPKAIVAFDKILNMIDAHTALAKTKTVGQVALRFMEDSGYLKSISNKDTPANLEKIMHLNQFFRKIEEFETANDDKSVNNFLNEFILAQEAGEEGAMSPLWEEGPEAVKIMTVHGAKGLEFTYVFLVSLVDKRFPSVERKEAIELPDDLIKEIIPEGDIHLQEERRLFYVGMTRAKKGLFFTSADDYGGTRKKKPSRFLVELGFQRKEGTEELDLVSRLKPAESLAQEVKDLSFLQKAIPEKASFTQIKAFETCPKQFKFAHILRIPVEGRFTFSFGKTIHNTLYEFFKLLKERAGKVQTDLFGAKTKKTKKPSATLAELMEIFEKEWIGDWYLSKKHEQEYKEKGERYLKEFYEYHQNGFPMPLFLEQPFNVKLGEYVLKGVIDRIDQIGKAKDEVELIDYKTGRPPKAGKIEEDDRKQLRIYDLAVREVFHLQPVQLSYYYIEGNQKLSFPSEAEKLDKIKEDLITAIKAMRVSDFKATPGFWCGTCDFKEICEDRWRG